MLTTTELLALLIGSGTKKHSAIDLARIILDNCGDDLNVLARFSVSDFTKIEGIGEARAVNIIAGLEFGSRRDAKQITKNQIVGSRDVYEYFSTRLSDLNHEQFWVLLLNRANRVLGLRQISEGGVTGTVADPRKIFKHALDVQASCIIAVHNHPSGNLKPSDADRSLTRKLRQGGMLIDIEVLDHLIIGDGQYFSFADAGIM